MEWKQIKQLADKYWKAETTPEEERELKKHITSSYDSTMDQREVEYFKTLSQFSSQKLTDDFDDRFFANIEKESKVRNIYQHKWFQLAASVLLVLGVVGGFEFQTYRSEQLARQQEAREAFEVAKSALFMVSEKMNKGSQYTMDGLSKFEETHQKIKIQNYNN
ncbi:MAG: hypothetical protein ABJF11_12990 [Reichenbachiella sp.]|uniref:hypothetical protein n=1 Tax=Reichenbachiella sp. TaxID=2184521 RepID=UPI003264DE7F